MPFREGFEQVFETVRAATVNSLPGQTIECYWLKDVYHAGRITDDILSGLQESSLCIADVTGNNPNVMWETGYAMALGKPTILIGQQVEQLPFDLKDHRILPYSLDRLEGLATTLAEAVRQTMARYEIDVPAEPERPVGLGSQTIAVTGTTQAHPARARRRVASILQPYLAAQTLWYCGGVGEIDECAIDYLLGQEQQVVTVGYHRYDYSQRVRDLMVQRKVMFLDASVESLPKGISGPSERDVLFCLRADLVILFWDGRSSGTKQLVDFFQDSGKNLLIAYV
jgi:hypothetical protein